MQFHNIFIYTFVLRFIAQQLKYFTLLILDCEIISSPCKQRQKLLAYTAQQFPIGRIAGRVIYLHCIEN